MSGLLILRGLLFAAECFAASLLLPVLAFAAAALLRRRAALRHLVFTTMFGVLAVLPLVALLLPPRRIVEHVSAPVAVDTAPVMAAPLVAAPPPSLLTPGNIVLALVALWLAGFCWQLLRLGVGGLGLMRLRRASSTFAAAVETGCAVRLADGEHGPSTFGIFRPVILLPRSAQAWPPARLEAVLRHEAAHVARRDTATQFIARLVCAVFWLNPLLWLAARSLRRNAEIAADDAVLASGLKPSLYAAELVSLAAESRGVTPGVAMAGPPLAERIQAVLAENSSRKGVSRMDMTKTVTLGLTAALLLGVARFDIAVAEDAAPASDVAPKVEKNVNVQIEKNVTIEAKAQAEVAAARAKAEAVAARAQAKAAAETDPVKKAQYQQEAAQVAQEAARVTAEADRVGADMRQRAAEVSVRVSAEKARAADMEQRAAQMAQTLSSEKARAADMEQRAGDMRLRADEAAARAKEMADTLTVSRTVTVRKTPQVAVTVSGLSGADGATPYNFTLVRTSALEATVAKALADAHLSENVTKALADAHISETIAKAIADARVAPVPPRPAVTITAPSSPPNAITVTPFAAPASPPNAITITPFAPLAPRAIAPVPPLPAPPAPG